MKPVPRKILLLVALGLLDPLACNGKRPWPPAPIEIALGEEECDACRMTIGDDRFGAQLHFVDRADVESFDDLGCLLAKHPDRAFGLEGVFVRAYDTRQWLRGDGAWIARSAELRSPMGYGFAAFPSEQAARAEATRHPDGKTASLRELIRAREGVAMDGPEPGHQVAAQGGH